MGILVFFILIAMVSVAGGIYIALESAGRTGVMETADSSPERADGTGESEESGQKPETVVPVDGENPEKIEEIAEPSPVEKKQEENPLQRIANSFSREREKEKEEPEKTESEKPAEKLPRPERGERPSSGCPVAIVIDDFGNNNRWVNEFCELEIPVTFAVLPRLKDSKAISRKAVDAGKEVILHLPMENLSGVNPGPGTLRTDMKREELISEFLLNLSFVPGADGFNNHEGSRLTGDEGAMSIIMEQAKLRGLFFVDSRTSSSSVAQDLARKAGIPSVRRSVFLDNMDSVDCIKLQLENLAGRALSDGSAVGIGHVRENTYLAIRDSYRDLEKKGIRFVFVRDLVE